MSRAEARAAGMTKYWPLFPCAKGHDAMRRLSGPCVVCERASRIAWQKANPEIAARSSSSAWSRANPERHRSNSRSWQKANGWYAVQATNRRRARKAAAEGFHTRDDIEALFSRQSGRCAHCDSPEKLEIDHIVPISKGGSDWPHNLQLLCRSCNATKGNRLPTERCCSSLDSSGNSSAD